MKLRGYIPKTTSDCVAAIIELANENEVLKAQVEELQNWITSLQKLLGSINNQK